jgi:hypothetical protein
MKAKAIIITATFFIISILFSCITWYEYFDTKIKSIDVSNAKFENSYFKLYNFDEINFDKYGIIVKCEIDDSLRYAEKQSASLNNFSMIQQAFCAYDPGYVCEYTLKDSVRSIDVFSVYDFNDSINSKININNFFSIYYYYGWGIGDSIKSSVLLSDFNEINNLLSVEDRRGNSLLLLLKLNYKPKYEKQRFVINMDFYSGKQLIDTTDDIRIL